MNTWAYVGVMAMYFVGIVTVVIVLGRLAPCFFGLHHLPPSPGNPGKTYRCASCGAYFHWDNWSRKWCSGKVPPTFAEQHQTYWEDYEARLEEKFGKDRDE